MKFAIIAAILCTWGLALLVAVGMIAMGIVSIVG